MSQKNALPSNPEPIRLPGLAPWTLLRRGLLLALMAALSVGLTACPEDDGSANVDVAEDEVCDDDADNDLDGDADCDDADCDGDPACQEP